MVSCLVGWIVGWWFGRLVCWQVGWLISWLLYLLFLLLVGWVVLQFGWSISAYVSRIRKDKGCILFLPHYSVSPHHTIQTSISDGYKWFWWDQKELVWFSWNLRTWSFTLKIKITLFAPQHIRQTVHLIYVRILVLQILKAFKIRLLIFSWVIFQVEFLSQTVYFPSLLIDWPLGRTVELKGVWHEIFELRLFSWISVPQAHKHSIGAVLNFFENSRRYSRFNVYRRCKRHRRKAVQRYQR